MKINRSRFFVFLLLSLFQTVLLFAKPSSDLTPAGLARLIHTRRGEWIALKAHLNLEFTASPSHKVTCRGELLYQRLDEKILLKGFNEQNELLFAFKTSDRNFELYLPQINEDTQGSIFDLEDSPEIQSHLRALDLYRALKPGALPVERMTISEKKNGNFLIQIKKTKSGTELSRELEASAKGDVVREIFYGPDGSAGTEILRSDFKAAFPYKIEMISASKKTTLVFTRLELLSEIVDSDFSLTLPENTKKISLE